MDRIFRALASTHRRAVLDALYKRAGQSVSELCADHGVSRQAMSRHIAVLESADLGTRPDVAGTANAGGPPSRESATVRVTMSPGGIGIV